MAGRVHILYILRCKVVMDYVYIIGAYPVSGRITLEFGLMLFHNLASCWKCVNYVCSLFLVMLFFSTLKYVHKFQRGIHGEMLRALLMEGS